MRSNGFTLIELLAVIVILAIIALIATPIVIHIIDDSKKSSEKESIKLYMDTVEKAIAKRQMSRPTFKPTKCNVGKDKTVKCGDETINIEIKGEIPDSGTIQFGNGMIIRGINLKLNGLYYQVTNGEVSEGTNEKSYSEYITLKEDNGIQGISPGDKYEYEVKDGIKYIFYLLKEEGDKVNLIMDRNICNDGTVTYMSTNNYCRYKWYSEESNNTYGPTTVMAELYAGTKDWDNVPTIELSGQNKYTDEANSTETDKGYTSLEIANGIATITGKLTTNTTTIGTSSIPVKARLPKYSEVNGAGCSGSNGSCPVWLVENMKYSTSKYSINDNSETYQNICGYWLLSSYPGNSSRARNVDYRGLVFYDGTIGYGIYGIRPVITVPISDLN